MSEEFKAGTPTNSKSIRLAKLGLINFKTERMFLLYGDPQSGKTYICSWLSRKVASEGKNVIYIDTEGKAKKWFRVWKDNDILENPERIKYFSISEMDKFKKFVHDVLEDKVNEYDASVVIVDTILYPYMEIEEAPSRAKAIAHDFKKIKDICMSNSALGIITSRLRKNKPKARGGRDLHHDTHHQIRLNIVGEGTKIEGLGGHENEHLETKRIVNYDRQKQFLIEVNNPNFGEIEVINK